MKILTFDLVKIIAGKDRGKSGKVMQALPKKKKVVVEKINIITKHIKKRSDGTPGQKIQFEKPIDVSNVELICPNCKKPTRVGYTELKTGKKIRVCKKCKENISNPKLTSQKK